YATSERQTVRRGAVRLSAEAPSAADVERLGGFLWGGTGTSVNASAVPEAVLPGQASVASASSTPDPGGAEGGGIWLWTGIGVGAGALALAAVGGAAVAALLTLGGEEPE